MSFWRRWFGGGAPPTPEEPEPARPAAAPESAPPRVELPPEDDPEGRLQRLGEDPSLLADDEVVLDALDRLRAHGREARAIDLMRRLLMHRPERLALHQRLAELLASRGDDAGAARLLEPFVDAPEAPLDLWMLAAEIAERRGDTTAALALYEQVVARDLDYPRARARVRRLREGERPAADLGATLMADGALTRGRYRVESELGRGGAGTVFVAEDLGLGRKVALKVYHRRGRAERHRLLVEARTPARFEHPGIVRIFDLDESLGAIAMERVLGGSVRQELKKGALPLARIHKWLLTTAEALALVHEAGFVHRDLKPSNFLLRADDRVVLTDFGVSCRAGYVPTAAEAGEGTLGYMPPEQRSGATAHPSMDLYALGVSIREIFGHAASAPPSQWGELAAACACEAPGHRPTVQELLRHLQA